jgi:hypothetical protein
VSFKLVIEAPFKFLLFVVLRALFEIACTPVVAACMCVFDRRASPVGAAGANDDRAPAHLLIDACEEFG